MQEDYQSVLLGRRSVRAFLEKPLPRALLEQVLEGANAAPSAHNTQPWHFCVVETSAAKKELAKRLGQAWLKPLLAQGLTQEAAAKKIASSIAFYSEAPVLITIFQQLGDAEQDGANHLENILGRQSVAAAATQLLLAAHAVALGGCWYCMPLHCADVFCSFFSLGERYRPEAMMVLGYPKATDEPARVKKPLCAVCSFY